MAARYGPNVLYFPATVLWKAAAANRPLGGGRLESLLDFAAEIADRLPVPWANYKRWVARMREETPMALDFCRGRDAQGSTSR